MVALQGDFNHDDIVGLIDTTLGQIKEVQKSLLNFCGDDKLSGRTAEKTIIQIPVPKEMVLAVEHLEKVVDYRNDLMNDLHSHYEDVRSRINESKKNIESFEVPTLRVDDAPVKKKKSK